MNKKLQVFSADLHIHTPASKCYKGKKNDEEYLEILKFAKKKELDIIAISDHNSIEGYIALYEQKQRIITEIKSYESLSDSKQAQKKIKELSKTIKLFQDILILPAIEFEVNNGIHLLIIFNPTTPITEIKQFLKNGGYGLDSYGLENSNTISNWSIFDLYEEVKNYDCLVIDGHTDSDKGILNTIPKGNTRAHAFKNSSLAGVCYKNEGQRKKLESTIKSSPDYYREKPLAFLKSSDSHELNEIGKSQSFFKLEILNWQAFKSAFENPIEYIFTNYPKVQGIIDNILKNEIYLTISEANSDTTKIFQEAICALNNTDGGYIILGIDDKKTFHGLDILDDEFESIKPYIDYVIDGIEKIGERIHYDFNFYPLQELKIIVTVKIFKGDRIIDIEGNGLIYGVENNNVQKLSASKIQKQIENQIIRIIENKIEKSLYEIDKHTSIIKTSLKSLPIISSYLDNSIPLQNIIIEPEILYPHKLSIEEQHSIKEYFAKNENGKSRGNIFYFEEDIFPRLKDAYLRVSMPKYFLKDLSYESKNKELIYLVPGGGVFLSNKTIVHYNPKGLPILQLEIDKSSDYSNKLLCAFLKSSFFLWFLLSKYDDINMHDPQIFRKIRLPKLNFKNPLIKSKISIIESEIESIFLIEQDFLKITLTEENCEEIVFNHNKSIDKHSANIDAMIFELLEIDADIIELIENTLKANQIYLPKMD